MGDQPQRVLGAQSGVLYSVYSARSVVFFHRSSMVCILEENPRHPRHLCSIVFSWLGSFGRGGCMGVVEAPIL